MIWMTFLGAGLALRQGGHVAITNLHDVMTTKAQRLLRTAIVLILLLFFGFMVFVGWEYMQRAQFPVCLYSDACGFQPADRAPIIGRQALHPCGSLHTT